MSEIVYDVVVVGAGCVGAIVAEKLAARGRRVLVLEAGPAYGRRSDHVEKYFAAAIKTPDAPWPDNVEAPRPKVLEMAFQADWRWNTLHHLVQRGPMPFASTYERGAGGTLNHWLGTCMRFLPSDFDLQSRLGVPDAQDWPIGYEQLEPWYCKAERELGVAGDHEQLDGMYGVARSAPFPQRAIRPSYLDDLMRSRLDGKTLSMPGVPSRVVRLLSTPQARNSERYDDRPACRGNSSCVPVCPIQAKYDPTVHIARSLRHSTPPTFSYRSVAHRLEVGATSSRIAAVHYRTWDDGIVEDRSARGRVVVLAGHGIETPRLLLNSHWRTGARGSPISVANSSGQVGRNLMDHLIVLAWGLSTDPVYPYRGPLSTSGIDSFRDGDDRRRRSAFRIEVGNDGWSWPAASPYTLLYELAARRKMRGPALRAALRDHLVREIRMAAELEMLPRSDNRVRLSGHLVDRLGIPRPEVEFDVSVYEKAAMAEARAALHGILSLFGMRSLDTSDPPHKAARVEHRGAHYEYRGAGHIMGTHRMGTDPADSVTDSFGRSHDHSNLFILGSGAFPSSGTANPTLTTVALTLRSISEIDSASVVSDESTTEGANDV